MMYCDQEYLIEKPLVLKKLMDTAESFSELSKCSAKKVCCILYKNGNIISLGLNGTSAGTVNCCDKFKKVDDIWYKRVGDLWEKCSDQREHYYWSSYNEIHAEINAISKALIPVTDSIAIITHSPCFNCAKSLLAFGITKIYYRYEYDDFENVFNFLKSQNIDLVKVL